LGIFKEFSDIQQNLPSRNHPIQNSGVLLGKAVFRSAHQLLTLGIFSGQNTWGPLAPQLQLKEMFVSPPEVLPTPPCCRSGASPGRTCHVTAETMDAPYCYEVGKPGTNSDGDQKYVWP